MCCMSTLQQLSQESNLVLPVLRPHDIDVFVFIQFRALCAENVQTRKCRSLDIDVLYSRSTPMRQFMYHDHGKDAIWP